LEDALLLQCPGNPGGSQRHELKAQQDYQFLEGYRLLRIGISSRY